MHLGKLLKFIDKSDKKIPVEGISFDSRKVKKNFIFFAIKGNKKSGVKFINQALAKGASAIVSSKKIQFKNYKVPLILVEDTRRSLSEACSNFYKKKPKNIIAVTGTNGKSSVVNFFYQILNFNKVPVASIGTLGIFSKKKSIKTKLTTIDPISLHKNLNNLAKNQKINHVILEASSHGLSQKRLDHLKIKIGIFTNFSHDHLDYHKNMKSYFNSKMYLFKNLLKKNSKIITDEGNKNFNVIKNIASKKKIKKYTIGSTTGNIKILENTYKKNMQITKVIINSKLVVLKIPLLGFYQVKNLLLAVLAASCCGLNLKKILRQIYKIKPIPGRLELISSLNNNSNIIIDFAHTPDALETSLLALKKQFKKKIVIVFGCGGERDKKKRAIMGKIANKYCRKIFITDDNPRNENPKQIRNDIIKNCKALAINIGNRKKAIETAINQLRPNEILLVAGKGHEKTQDYGNKIIKFSDKKIIVKLLIKKKFSKKKIDLSNFLINKTFNSNNLKDVNYNGVSINSQTIKKNNLFFAIRGKNTDGHKFAKQAIKNGAIRAVISRKITKLSKNKSIKVKNTFSSLNDLARTTRENTLARIIGITGSAGKTTLKNLIAFSLKNYGEVYFSPHSYNNKFGVPLSLSNLKSNTNYGVFEIGMDKKGEIKNLSKLVKPEIAIITNISGAHFKNFNSLNDIARAKAEIIDNVVDNGNVILNKDDKFFNFLSNEASKKQKKVISFSLNKKADICLLKVNKFKNFHRLKIKVKDEVFYFETKNSTYNFLSNVMACIAVLYVLNLNLKNMKNKFPNFIIPEGRGDIKIIKKFKKRFKLIDESYNANPLSMKSAIINMNYYKKKGSEKKLVFLGDMLELGKKAKKLHKDLSNEINKSSIDKVYVYGKHIKETFNFLLPNKKGKVFKNFKEAYDHFSKILHNNDLLMIKGSNATGLNKFIKNIKKGQISAI